MSYASISEFRLINTLSQDVWIPDGYKPLTVKENRDDLIMYALVDPYAPYANRKVFIISAGMIFDESTLENTQYFASVEAKYVMLHVFMEQPPEE